MPGERRGVTRPISSVSSFEGEQTRHSLLTNYYKQNTQQQFSQPGQASLPLSPCLAAPASSLKQRNEFIIHQKGSEQLQSDRGSHNIGISIKPYLHPPWPGLGAFLQRTVTALCLFLTTLGSLWSSLKRPISQ